ncbi:MAG: FxsA family protein [Rhodospirillales bacterium]|nr:FxsA family protein [Rhodospirillales bacterium]
MPLMILFLIGLPILDIASLIEVGGFIGTGPTIALLFASVVAGSALMRLQGFSILRQAQETLAAGKPPAREMFDGACVIIGGLLLIFPGFVSDGLGLMLLFPLIRSGLWRWIDRSIQRSGRVAVWTITPDGNGPNGPATGPVIDGDYVRVNPSEEDGPSPQNSNEGDPRKAPTHRPPSPWKPADGTSGPEVVRSDDP